MAKPLMNQNRTQALDYEQFAERGLRYAYSIVRNVSDAEEAVQEAFCRQVQSGNNDLGVPHTAAIYFKTIRNLCIDVLRRRRRHVPFTAESAEVGSPRANAENGMTELQSRIAAAMSKLPEEWSGALKLRVEASLRYDEIAGVLDCSYAQVRTWIYRARRQLEQELHDVLSEHGMR
jgi:RNA polymerase sigma-70 factor (ECF subfamily)